jgi:ABC-type transport system involved in multi-copper enzyme maturation permease subunit
VTAWWGFVRNPVFLREVRVRMRGWRTPGLIVLYVGLLGLLALLIFAASMKGNRPAGFAPEVGGIIYAALAMFQLVLLVLAVPGLAAGAIAGERERQTLDLLLITRLSAAQVVVGKLLAATGFALLLMFASLPVFGLIFLFGGFSLYRLGLSAVVYVVTVLLLGAVSLYFSAVYRRTQTAVVAAYGVVTTWILLSPLFGALTYHVFFERDNPPVWGLIFAYTNPAFGLAAAAGQPLSEMTRLYTPILSTEALREAIWWKYCLIALLIIGVLLWRTVQRIQPLKSKG